MNEFDGKNIHSFTLTDNRTGESYDLPVIEGSTGPDVIDVRRLYADTGCFTYDPGFTSTGSCESNITFIDGEKGILRYRGYQIDEDSGRVFQSNILVTNNNWSCFRYSTWILSL